MATLNPQIPLEARQTVLDQVVAGTSFTGYEITLEVRRRLGPTVEVPHSVVNNIVQTMFANGEMTGYNRAPDTTVKAATPPFRYAPPVARGVTATAPAFISVNRASLPVNLRYSNPVASLIRAYALEARAFHEAAGIADTPFKVWLPTAQNPTLRVRSMGAVPSETEVQARYSLASGSQNDLSSKAAFAYANEFRVTTFKNGIAKTFKAALDLNLVGTVTKDGEVPTKQEDGVEIEIAVKPTDVQRFCDDAAHVFAYLRVPPRLQGGILGAFNRPKPVLKGDNWRITREGGALAIVGDSAIPINSFNFLPVGSPVNIEIDFAPGELAITDNGESLDYTGSTRLALINAFKKVQAESLQLSEERIKSEPNIWNAKLRFAQLANVVGNTLRSLQKKLVWNGIAIEDERFTELNAGEVTIALTSRTAFGSGLRTQKTTVVEAQTHTVIFLNDLGTRTGSPSRLRAYFAAHPSVQRAYVLTFISDAARDRFIVANNFQTVPLSLLSSVPKPLSATQHGTRRTNRIPFDPIRHTLQTPVNPLVDKFPDLDDAEFTRLEQWARIATFNANQWPDFKRLYKKAEANVWPLQDRSRWDKTESNLPSGASLPGEREVFLLGILIGRLDSEAARRSDDSRYPNGGPTAKTVAYLTRRAARLLSFLRDHKDLSVERRALLAPLVAGSMLRDKCDNVQETLAARLDLINSEELGKRPELVNRVWKDATLPLPVLKWAFEWLKGRGEVASGTLSHVQRFAAQGEAEIVLAILPPLLESGPVWETNFGPDDLSKALQNIGASKGALLRLFARFPVLKASEDWLLGALDTPEADEPEVVEFVRPLVEAEARAGNLEVALRLSSSLRTLFGESLVATHPKGLSVAQWQQIESSHLVEALSPALRQMPLSPGVAQFLWEHAALCSEFFRFGGEEAFVAAFTSTIERQAKAEDFAFALQLSPRGRALFFETLRTNISLSTWQKLEASEVENFTAELAGLPLSGAFWEFLVSLESERRAQWLQRVGEERANREFIQQPAFLAQTLMEGDTQGLKPLVESWLRANLNNDMRSDAPVVLLAATSVNNDWSSLALSFISTRPLNLRISLRLMESGLPEAQAFAMPYFEGASVKWPMRVLALADSPVAATRAYALNLLARFPTRWTAALLESLAQHDDPRVQAFVARQLEQVAGQAQNEVVKTFDEAILNGRGCARSAKIGVQRRLNGHEANEAVDIETLLDAARNGAPRDRAWALQQLVQLQMRGVSIPELTVSGAVARASQN